MNNLKRDDESRINRTKDIKILKTGLYSMEETITIDKKALTGLLNLAEEMQLRIESLELASDPEMMEGHRRAKEQIKNRDFGNWNEL